MEVNLAGVFCLCCAQSEGGYVRDPGDPGGETKYGVSKRSFPKMDIKKLTLQQAARIYRRHFWDQIRGDQIQDQKLANKLFDLSVNIGVSRAVRILQQACGLCGLPVAENGIPTASTLTVVNMCDARSLLAEFKALAAGYYRDLAHQHPALQRFLGGWLKRAAL